MITQEYLNTLPYTRSILLDSFDRIKQFIHFTQRLPGEVYLKSEDRIVSGRSLMGIFSLELCRPLTYYSSEHPGQGLEGLTTSESAQKAS